MMVGFWLLIARLKIRKQGGEHHRLRHRPAVIPEFCLILSLGGLNQTSLPSCNAIVKRKFPNDWIRHNIALCQICAENYPVRTRCSFSKRLPAAEISRMPHASCTSVNLP